MTTDQLPAGAITFDFGRIPADYPGPWTGEPDKVVWVDPTTDLDCMILRNRMGALCGYVAVPEGHPWFEVGYDDVRLPWVKDQGEDWPRVHGGLTFADFCHEGKGDDAICHTPAPGRPGHVWWLGFDCAHSGDVAPMADKALIDLGHPDLVEGMHAGPFGVPDIYKPVGYVVEQCQLLAVQARAAAAATQ